MFIERPNQSPAPTAVLSAAALARVDGADRPAIPPAFHFGGTGAHHIAGFSTFIVGNSAACGLKARNMSAQGKRRETSAALGGGAKERPSPERAAPCGLARGLGEGPVLCRPFRAVNFIGRLTQGVARRLAAPWAVMLSRFQRCDEAGGCPLQTSSNQTAELWLTVMLGDLAILYITIYPL